MKKKNQYSKVLKEQKLDSLYTFLFVVVHVKD